MRVPLLCIPMLCLLLIVRAPAQTTRGALPPDKDQVTRTELFRRSDISIARGVKFLLSRQNIDGSWESDGPNEDKTGSTALVTLALLYCGESYQSPPLVRAIKFLKQSQPQRIRHATYSVALRASVYASLPEQLRKTELPADLRWLIQAMIPSGPRRGMYDYGTFRAAGGDFSNSQYGVLGVWYAAQAGMEVQQNYWRQIETGWLAAQNKDGGFPYRPGSESYASMTAAGAVTLFITNDYIHSREAEDLNKTVVNKPLDAAMAWLGQNFSVDQNIGKDVVPGRQRRPDAEVLDLLGELGRSPGYQIHYMLFGYERVGEASGLTRFGDHKWFDEGADYLIRTQAYDGSWTGRNGSDIDSAYSLLFLSRGRAPIVAQKLQFSGRWNNRARDIAGFTQFMRRATERHVNWQIVSIDATPEELRQAPMLYVASDKAIELDNVQVARLKAYIDQGGMLVCVNEGKREEFSQSIVYLAAKMYPEYQFRPLPQNHLMYTANFPVTKNETGEGLSNGLRELIVMYPNQDMSWKFQSAAGAFQPKVTPYASLANLWLYVTDRANPRFKGEDTWVVHNPGAVALRTGKLVRLEHEGNWNPEPAAWQRLANIMHNFDQFDLTVEAATDPKDANIAHLTNTRAINLTPAAITTLRQYLNRGGLLLCDAAGGSGETAGSFEPLLKQLYPEVTFAPLPLEHPIYHAHVFGGSEVESVQYRRSENLTPVRIPRLRGATVGGKLVAIISYEDLTGGLVGYSTAGLAGYTPTSATELVRNIILWRTSALR